MSTSVNIALMQSLPLPAPEAGVPDWIHLLPAGQKIHTGDGRGPYHAASLQAVIAASGTAKLPIDENHAIDLAAPRGEPAPARGHILELQARADGIWGRVEWTPSGRVLMAERAYLGISPVITHDAAGNVIAILRASLTNRPNLRGLTALHQENSMSLIERLVAALGLDAATGEDALVTHVTSLHQQQATTTALQSSLSEIGVALGAAQDAKPDAVLAAAKVAAAREGTLVPALQAQVTSLQSEVKTLRDTDTRRAAEQFVDGAKAELRMGITDANRDEFVAMHMANPAQVEKLINGFPKMPGTSVVPNVNVALQADSRDLVSKARAYQATQKAAGNDVGWADAVMTVSGGAQ